LGRCGKNCPKKDTKILRFRKRIYIINTELNENKNRASQNDFFLNRPKWPLKNGEKSVKFVLGALQLLDIINIFMV